MTIETMIEQAEKLESKAIALREQAGKVKKERILKDDTMREWLDYDFESSSGLTEEFALFTKQFISALIKKMVGYEIENFSRGHFCINGFVRNLTTDKLVYFSTSDVRHFSNEWYNNLLIRTAKHNKDWLGGCNCYTTFRNIKRDIDKLIK